MTISAADLERIRRKNQAQRIFLAVEDPSTVWTGSVTGAPNVGATDIGFSGAVETETPLAHATLLVGDRTNTEELKYVRYRSKTGSTLKVGYNHIEWETNQQLAIIKQIRPWALLPSVDGEQEDQDTTYSNQNTQVKPIARIGCSAACAFRDEDGYARIKFYSNSVAVTGSLSTHAWTFQGGLPASSSQSGTENNPIEVRFGSTGQFWVTYTVTDTNGKSATRYCIVYIYDRYGSGAPNQDFEVESLSYSFDDGGWTMSLKSYGDFDWLEGSQIVLFSDQVWNGEQVNVGNSPWKYRENILFCGWIQGSRTAKNSEYSYVSVKCYGPVGWLKEAEAWPANLKYSGGSNWHTLGASMTPDRAALHLLQEHSNLCLISDVNLTGNSKSLLYVDCQESRLYEQIDFQIYDSLKARLTSDSLGRLIAEQNQQLIALASRTVGSELELTSEDWREELDIGEELDFYPCCQIDFTGFYYSGADPKRYYSLAPGRELPTGQVEQVTGSRADSQNETNILSGMYLAWLNNEFKDVGIPMAGFAPLAGAPQSRITVTLAANENKRGLTWTSKAFWIRSIEHDFSKASILTTLRVEAESDGPPGVTNYIPEDTPPAYPDYSFDFDVPVEPTVPPEPDDVPGEGKTCYVATITHVGRTTNFLDSSPSWLGLGSFSNIRDFILDPWSPATTAWVLTKTDVYRTTNLNEASPTWTNVLTKATVNTAIGAAGDSEDSFHRIEGTITQSGLFYMTYNTPSSGGKQVCIRTTNNGSSFTYRVIQSASKPFLPLEVSQHNPNIVLVGSGTGSPGMNVWKCTNGTGAFTFSQAGSFGPLEIHQFFMPYNDNSGDQISYAVVDGSAGGVGLDGIWMTTDMWATHSDVSPSGVGVGTLVAPNKIFTGAYTQNRQIMFFSDGVNVWTSVNGGASWTAATDISVDGAQFTGFGGFPYNGGRIQAVNGFTAGAKIKLSLDNGVTWLDKTGDWESAVGSWSGGVMCVPLWTE